MKDIIYPLSIESVDFTQAHQAAYILCEMSYKTRVSQGILAFVSIDSIVQNRILPNEKTYPGKQKKILASFLSEKIQKKPVLLTYDKQVIDLNRVKNPKPSVVHTSGGITYRLWEIKEPKKVQSLTLQLNNIEQFLVADGHHRLAALTQYYQNKTTLFAPCFLAFLTEKNQILLHGFNKLLTGVDIPPQKLIKLMYLYFDVKKAGAFKDVNTSKPAIYLNSTWYGFSLKDKLKTSPSFDISASYVHCFLFENLLGITSDVIENQVISISHNTPVEVLEQWVNNSMYHSAIYIPSMNDIEFTYHVKSGCLFPQNTTFFSPKIDHDLFLFLMQKQKMLLDLQTIESVV